MANPRWTGTTNTTWSTNGNWDSGSAPVDADNVYIENSSVNIDAGLNASSIQPTAFYVPMNYLGKIGTATVGSGYLQLGPLAAYFGAVGNGTSTSAGSGRIKHDAGTDPCVWTIYNTSASTADAGLPPVRLKGSNTSNTLYVFGGSVGGAVEDADEVLALSEFSVSGSTTKLTLGAGAAWVTGYQTDGTVTINSGGTTFTQQGGSLYAYGTNPTRALTIGGTAYINFRAATLSVSGITRSSTTATATVASTASLATGDTVRIMGAGQAGYNGYKTITVASGTTFTFTVASDDVTPATGTITCRKAITSLTLTTDAAVVDFSGDSRLVDVATLTVRAGQYKVNRANPTHMNIGTLVLDGPSRVQALS